MQNKMTIWCIFQRDKKTSEKVLHFVSSFSFPSKVTSILRLSYFLENPYINFLMKTTVCQVFFLHAPKETVA